MTTYDGNDWMIGYTPPSIASDGIGRLRVGRHPSNGWDLGYSLTTGHCYLRLREFSEEEQAARLRNLSLALMAEGFEPALVMREFAKIRVWREMSWPDLNGGMARAFIPGRYTEFNPHNP